MHDWCAVYAEAWCTQRECNQDSRLQIHSRLTLASERDCGLPSSQVAVAENTATSARAEKAPDTPIKMLEVVGRISNLPQDPQDSNYIGLLLLTW